MTHRQDSSQTDSVILKWTTHRLRENPGALFVVVPCIAVASAAGAVVFGSVLAGLAAGVVLAAAIGDYLLPVRHCIREQKVTTSCLLNRQEIAWHNVRRVWLTDSGVKLSPLVRRSRLEAYRGLFLRFGQEAGAREQVLSAVARLRPMPEDASESAPSLAADTPGADA